MKIFDGEFMDIHMATLEALTTATKTIIDLYRKIEKLETKLDERDRNNNQG